MSIIPQTQQCVRCKHTKQLDDFYICRGKHKTVCKACEIKYARERQKRNAERENFQPPPYKVCSRCKIEKPSFEFARCTNSDTGLQSECKGCMKISRREYRENNIERARHLDKLSRERHKEKRRQRFKAWCERNKAYNNQKSREYRSKNKDKVAQWKREWYRAHPEYEVARTSKRRAYLRQNGGHYTPREWLALCAKYEHKCLCCGEMKKLTVDHVLPISKGGRNDISNIQPLCLECNIRKHDRHIDYRPQVVEPNFAADVQAAIDETVD